MPNPELEMVVAMLRSAPVFADADVATMRAGMEAFTASAPLADDIRLEAVDAGGVAAEWAIADASRDDCCILYFHGGGYVIGSTRTHRRLVGSIGRAAQARMLSVDYRLGPEHPHPAAVEDGVAAYRFLRAQGFAAERIGIAGDSAGGGLTMATLLALRDAGDCLPAAAACISPWVDLTLSGESMTTKAAVDPMVQRDGLDKMAALYAGANDRRAPLVSPLFADLAGLPEILVHVGTAETLLDDSLRLVARLRAAGVEVSLDAYEDMIHVFHAFAGILPEARDAIDSIGAYFRRRLTRPS